MNSFSNAVFHQLMREPSNENRNISARITKQTQWDRSEVDQLEKKKIDAILLGFEMLWSIVKWKIYFALPRHLQSSCKLKKNVTHLD